MSDGKDVYDESSDRKIVFGLDASAVDVFGQQMIPNNGVGLSELVKNSYDADASIVEIHLGAAFEKDLDETYVAIKDDGEGMSIDDLEKKFFVIGHQHKRKEMTAKGRIPVGEKGVGRFAVQRLGKRLLLFTKKEGGPEYKVEVDWERYTAGKKIDEIELDVQVDHKKQFEEDGHGTILLIGNLRERFDGNTLAHLKRAVNHLISPFAQTRDFKIDLVVPKQMEHLSSIKDLGTAAFARQAHFQFRGTLDRTTGLLDYIFDNNHPWSEDKGKHETGVWDDWKDSFLRGIEFDFYIFNKTSALLGASGIVKTELNRLVGIRLYRNGLRVYPYGQNKGKRPENDWLGITRERAQNTKSWFGEDQCIGAINFRRDRNLNWELKDKTDRSGMIENEHWNELVRISREVVKKIHAEFMAGKGVNPLIAPKQAYKGTQLGLTDFSQNEKTSTPAPKESKVKQTPLPDPIPYAPAEDEVPSELRSARERVQEASILISEIMRDLKMDKMGVKSRVQDAESKLNEALRDLGE